MQVNPIALCSDAQVELQVLMVVLAALNTALATWLVHRRAKADKRDNGNNGKGSASSGYHSQRGNKLPPEDWPSAGPRS